jgi:hypothetical protein
VAVDGLAGDAVDLGVAPRDRVAPPAARLGALSHQRVGVALGLLPAPLRQEEERHDQATLPVARVAGHVGLEEGDAGPPVPGARPGALREPGDEQGVEALPDVALPALAAEHPAGGDARGLQPGAEGADRARLGAATAR